MGLIVNFSDFVNKTGTSLSASDHLVGFTTNLDGSRQEIKLTVADLITFVESNSGNDLYTLLYAYSAKWDSAYSSINGLSSGLSLVFTNSSNWEGNYTTVKNNSSFWTTAYNTVQKLTGNFINVNSNVFTINSSNQDLYNKKFINVFHDDTATVTVMNNVSYGFSCKIFNNSTHYILLSSYSPFNYKGKGEYLNDQYGLVNLEWDGNFAYGYGDLESAIGPAYPNALLTNEDAYLLQQDDSLILY